MTAAQLIADVLVGLAVAAVALSVAGVVAMPSVFDRLHFLAPTSAVAPVLIAAAIVTRQGLDARGVKAILVALTLAGLNPVLTQVTARAARVRQHGDWRPRVKERSPG